ncbi:hypothetical protein JL720_13632 [Aureococcus anophagefferens]|nr:hypothetical protein JL720_13632 [Aureococcus anophagefferens]
MDATAEALAHDTCLEFELPRGAIAKAVAKWFDGVGKDDRVHAAIARAGGLFSLYLTAAAVQICKDNKRQTISPQDVVVALKSLDFDKDFVAECAGFLERDREQRPKHAPTLKKYRGVYQGSINAWYSQISIAGQPIHLGSFAAPEDAARAYDRAIWSKLGTAAASLLNFPDDIPESLPYLKEQLKEQEAAKAAEAARGGDDFEFRLVGVDDDFDTGLPGGAWGEKLYECKNGEPTVPKEYKKGDWGSIAGDWYVIAGNVPRSDNAVGSCPQMKFELPDKGAHVMNQEMMYTSEGTNYWWNYTGNYQLDDYKGVWKNEDGDGTNTDMYSRSELRLRRGPTRAKVVRMVLLRPSGDDHAQGHPVDPQESYEYDKKFEKLVKKAMVAAGVLKDGDVYYYKQEASCDYTWFHTGDDVESIHGSLVQYYEERNETTTEDNSRGTQ